MKETIGNVLLNLDYYDGEDAYSDGSIEDRLLITDSRGQHKNNRSRKRLTAADIDTLEVEAVEMPIIQQGQNATDAEAYRVNDYSIF